MIFNSTDKYQFTSRINLEGNPLEIVSQTKLLGLILTDDLTWWQNTVSLVKRAYGRMELLRRLSNFNSPIKDMLHVYILYIVQKNAFRKFVKENYISYEKSLRTLQMITLYERREVLLLRYGQKCLKLEQTKYLFPLSQKTLEMKLRKPEPFEVLHSNTERLKCSTVPYIQRMLNRKANETKKNHQWPSCFSTLSQ